MFFLGKVVFDNIFPSLYDLHVNVPSALGQTWSFETPITLTLIGWYCPIPWIPNCMSACPVSKQKNKEKSFAYSMSVSTL